MYAGVARATNSNQSPNTQENYLADTRRVLTSVVKRETTLTIIKGPQVTAKWETMWDCFDNQDVGLEAAIILRKRNSSLVKRSCAENVTGLKPFAEGMGVLARGSG